MIHINIFIYLIKLLILFNKKCNKYNIEKNSCLQIIISLCEPVNLKIDIIQFSLIQVG
jgi:hypothetical protein